MDHRSATTNSDSPAAHYPDVVRFAQRLIQYDTSNYGGGLSAGPVEAEAARYVMDLLLGMEYEPEWIEPAPGRPSIVVRIPGGDPNAPGLVMHGHLDVVPVDPGEWEHPPFGGEIHDDVLWGRGAVDMKDMCAMMLALLKDMAENKWQPPRNLLVVFFADEEAGGAAGAAWMVQHRPEIFKGYTHAISEVGGYNTFVNGKRVYLIQTAEKGQLWLKLTATGTPGHGSLPNNNNAITKLACALANLGTHEWPIDVTPTVHELLSGVATMIGAPYDPSDKTSLNALIEALGSAKSFVAATISTTVNPTQMEGGSVVNMVPGSAGAMVDIRQLPGTEESVKARLKELIGDVDAESLFEAPAIEAPVRAPIVEAMAQAILEHDPDSTVLPYMLSAGTDNKHLSALGIHGYGFVPISLPEGFDFPAMFHAANERIPVQSLIDGLAVLKRFIELY